MSRFEELIKTNERDLTRIRSQYFPLIANEVITGYNLYLTLFDYSQGRLFLNYLHSNLKPGDAHFRELSEKLMDKGFIEERIVVDSEVIDKERIIAREADYLTRADWEDPPNMRYFDFSGREIPAEKAKQIHQMTHKLTLPGMVILGVFVAGVELPCTGGPYLAILVFLSQNFNLKAFLLLVLYNIIFVLPLIVMLFMVYFGLKIQHLKRWKQDYRIYMRFATGIILIALGWLLILIANGTVALN